MTQNMDKSGQLDNGLVTDPDEMLTVRQVAKRLGLNARYVRNDLVKPATPESIAAGKHIESMRVGNGPKPQYRIDPVWVDEFIERRRTARGKAPVAANSSAPAA